MWVCLQSVLANDEKENVELLVVKYSHVVFTVFFFCYCFSVSFILLPVGFSFVVLGLRQVPAEGGPQVMAEKRSIHLNRVLL